MPIPDPLIYQLKVVLQGISPMIWRRVLICGDTTIADLHYILQVAVRWSGGHLHQFRSMNDLFTNMISQTTGNT